MRDILAERILVAVMSWGAEDLARELPFLQAMASIKYDEYQQFSPGLKFLESLAMWLNQFKTKEERNIAYSFIKNRLIFISNSELVHLVSISFPDLIQPFLLNRVAAQLAIPNSSIKKIINSPEYRIVLRQSLFVGLTEGAHLDVFRRSNRQISNEQVLLSSDISNDKSKELTKALKNDLQLITGSRTSTDDIGFSDIFLIDDFSASGISYFRKKADGTYRGKIFKVLEGIYSGTNSYNGLFKKDNLQVSVLLYIATNKAISYLQESIRSWLHEQGIQLKPNIFVVHELADSSCVREGYDDDLINILQRYYDESIQDEHYDVGGNHKPYLGFNECALPLVLSHNTPNNSIPLLWFDTKMYIGLFPRVSRHKEVTK